MTDLIIRELDRYKAENERLRTAQADAIRKIAVKIMNERSGTKPYMTLPEWEIFLAEVLNSAVTSFNLN